MLLYPVKNPFSKSCQGLLEEKSVEIAVPVFLVLIPLLSDVP
jgi:hypothetical protein